MTEHESEQNQEALAECHRLNQQKDEVLTGVVHDLRNPIHTLTMALELIRYGLGDPLTERQQELLKISLQATKSMDRLIEEILEVTRVQNDNLRVECGPLDISKLVDGKVKEFTPRMSPAVIIKAMGTNYSVIAWADPFLLERVLDNLIGNALKFTNEGEIAVEVHHTDKTVTLRVRDTGIGIPTSELEAIFDPYHQLTTKKTRQGLGFGLYLVREFVERMGGTISIESTVGSGTTFTLTFLTSPVM